jgi:two-component system, NtrC family, sensor histidine kinase KinB
VTVTLKLRTRLAIAGSLLIATTVATGIWSVSSFRRVSQVVGKTVADDERTTDATSKLAGNLEREDDAMLLTLSEEATGRADLAVQRAKVTAALHHVATELDAPSEREIATQLRTDIDAYHRAVDALVARAQAPDARMQYHENVNPLLRRAVATTYQIRDRHFRSSQAVAEWARDQSTRSMEIVAAISLAALLLLIAIVYHLARVVMLPLGEMRRAVEAIRRSDFSQRVGVRRDDELGRLAGGLNQMADELEEFRRANIGEVIRAKETLEATLEALPDAVVVIDEDRRVSSENPRAREILGSAREGSLDDLRLPASTLETIDAVLRSGVAREPTVDLAKTIEVAVDGSARRWLPRIVPIKRRRGAVLVLSDVTDLVRLDEMRLELVAVASHELRTPLTTLRMTLLMLQERAAHYGDRDRDLVATAMLGIDQLSVLVDEFLDLTQIEAGQLRLHWGRVALQDLVDTCVRAVAPSCDAAEIALEVALAPGIPSSIAGDRARIAMVLSNVLSNAVKYTPEHGRIALRVAMAPDPRLVVIEVTDTGSGVPPELRERIFERFFRVEHARGGEISLAGVGIGLYIARQVIEAHGGQIRCEESADHGAQFVLTIPPEREEGRSRDRPQRVTAAPAIRRLGL